MTIRQLECILLERLDRARHEYKRKHNMETREQFIAAQREFDRLIIHREIPEEFQAEVAVGQLVDQWIDKNVEMKVEDSFTMFRLRQGEGTE